MDKKELFLLEKHKEKFLNNSFNEMDIYSFLILIRNYIKKDSQQYLYICEFCDLVAHRKRNQGFIMENICNMVERRYRQADDNTISGIACIDKEKWINEWKCLSMTLDLKLTERNINEITMCIYSLVHHTYYDNKGNNKKDTGGSLRNHSHHRGQVSMGIDKNNNLYLSCTAGRKDSRIVTISKYENCISNMEKVVFFKKDIFLDRNACNQLVCINIT